LEVEGNVTSFNTTSFEQSIADVLGIEYWRVKVTGLELGTRKQTNSGTIKVLFVIYDDPVKTNANSDSIVVAQQLQQIVESDPEVLVTAGVPPVVSVQVDTSNAANYQEPSDSSNDQTKAILIGVLIPVGFVLLIAGAAGIWLFAKRRFGSEGSEEDPDPTLGAPGLGPSETIGVVEPRLRPMKKDWTYNVTPTMKKKNDSVLEQYKKQIQPQIQKEATKYEDRSGSESSDQSESESDSKSSGSESSSTTNSTDAMSTPNSVSSYEDESLPQPQFMPMARSNSNSNNKK